MTPRSLFERAAPDCADCGARIQRVEYSWHVDEDGAWRMRGFTVCLNQHRRIVVPLSI